MLHSLDVNRYLNITSLKWLKVAMGQTNKQTYGRTLLVTKVAIVPEKLN